MYGPCWPTQVPHCCGSKQSPALTCPSALAARAAAPQAATAVGQELAEERSKRQELQAAMQQIVLNREAAEEEAAEAAVRQAAQEAAQEVAPMEEAGVEPEEEQDQGPEPYVPRVGVREAGSVVFCLGDLQGHASCVCTCA